MTWYLLVSRNFYVRYLIILSYLLITSSDVENLPAVWDVTRQESRSSAGNCHADEPAGITQLSRP